MKSRAGADLPPQPQMGGTPMYIDHTHIHAPIYTHAAIHMGTCIYIRILARTGVLDRLRQLPLHVFQPAHVLPRDIGDFHLCFDCV